VRVTAHSEQPGWVADTPNASGYFDVGVTFQGAPAQTISLNMGARQAGGGWRLDEISTTQYGGANYTAAAKQQDGYPQGSFSHLYVTQDGLVTAVYSNKIELAQYQLSITRFLNPWGLEKIGNNLFAATRHSGPGTLHAPGEGGAAVVLGGFLEQSNVETATEIVSMIMTQRGFQANSKVVTTHDTMIATAIEMKR
jgi:flagellar hook protein FlgE